MSEMNGSKALKRNGDALPKSGKATQNGSAEYLWLSSSSGSRGSRGSRTALPKPGKATDSLVPDQFNPSAGSNTERVIAEMEKRWAELFALARAAEARVQAAEEKREQAEHSLKQETNQRLVAEQRLRQLEEHRLRQLQAVKNEGMKTLKTALAHAGARLKEAKAELLRLRTTPSPWRSRWRRPIGRGPKPRLSRAPQRRKRIESKRFLSERKPPPTKPQNDTFYSVFLFLQIEERKLSPAKPRKDTKPPKLCNISGKNSESLLGKSQNPSIKC